MDTVQAKSRRSLRETLAVGGAATTIGTYLFALIVLAALFAPLLAPHDPFAQDLSNRLQKPFWQEGYNPAHPLGTDVLGRDYLSRILHGARISLLIGIVTTCASGFIGSILGIFAGYYGGRVDLVITYVITCRLAMPVVVIALAAVSLLGNSLFLITCVLGLLLWDRFAVVARSSTQQLVSAEFVNAAKTAGVSDFRIILFEIFPNLRNALLVVASVEVAHAVLLEAALSFLGLGVQPPLPSWGLMIAEAREYFLFEPWLIIIPGVCLFLLVFSINLLSDGLRQIAEK